MVQQTKKPECFTRGTEPRTVGDILHELVNSDQLFKSIHPNTELCVDLKFLASEPGRLDMGDSRFGAITRDGEEHYTFADLDLLSKAIYGDEEEAEDAPEPAASDASEKKGTRVKRNPIVIPGNCVNLHRDDDGRLYLTFRYPELTEQYTWKSYCIEAANEILSMISLVEEERPTART